MEPLTAIATIAAKYGASQLIRALTGNDELSGLASELLGELVASEDRLSEQLAGIDRQLEELLDQRYTIALGAGQRALRDASTAPEPTSRAAELARARDLFREAAAAASAKSPLQIAVAERYVALCSLSAGRPDTVPAALDTVNEAAFRALTEALPLFGPRAYEKAREQVPRLGLRGRREERIDTLGSDIVDAVDGVVDLALNLLAESEALARGLGQDLGPEIDVDLLLPAGYEDDDRLASTAQVVVRPTGPGPLRFGPLTVAFGEPTPVPGVRSPAPPDAASALVAAKLARTGPPERPPGFEVEVLVRSDFPVSPALIVSLRPGLVLADEAMAEVMPGQPAFTGVASGMLAARMQEIRLPFFRPDRFVNEWTVNINNVLIFQSSDRQLHELDSGGR
ncbi:MULTISPECIES: hypothetical protein [Amycolatopsis]|uniref:Uncharacterized protein n=1 Tax=Amycolatopsis dendrobii TaxID=2760662 RepID=A0A7W3ZE57_9PSEU|nr:MULTISPECIES: hypothetical protein [Amycolatopsis]MBB1158175.1 hypothetical protein [Amycolatopsis dendrobii]UKD56976.1 hypothetical protein L3Q65_09720 [Amycolatopsis sp. FU40]